MFLFICFFLIFYITYYRVTRNINFILYIALLCTSFVFAFWILRFLLFQISFDCQFVFSFFNILFFCSWWFLLIVNWFFEVNFWLIWKLSRFKLILFVFNRLWLGLKLTRFWLIILNLLNTHELIKSFIYFLFDQLQQYLSITPFTLSLIWVVNLYNLLLISAAV